MRTGTDPPVAGTSMVPPGEAEYAHAPSWVTLIVALPVGIAALPLGHETVSVPVRGVPEGFAGPRPETKPFPEFPPPAMIQSAFAVVCHMQAVTPVEWIADCLTSPLGSMSFCWSATPCNHSRPTVRWS